MPFGQSEPFVQIVVEFWFFKWNSAPSFMGSYLTCDGVLSEKFEKQLINKQPDKKHYDEDWCDAKNELSESDYRFAQTEFNDWLVVIGKARSKSLSGSYFKESAFPNNSLIESVMNALLEAQVSADKKEGNEVIDRGGPSVLFTFYLNFTL